MKKRIVLISASAIGLVIAGGVGFRAFADHRDRHVTLRAELRGLNEVPPTTSKGSASLRAQLDEEAGTIDFTLDFADLTQAPTVAHIHFGPTKVNGGVMVFFCGGGGKPACPTTTTGTITGTIAAADVLGPAPQGITAGDFDDVVRAIRTGNSYANMHNLNFPNGEVRGKVTASGHSQHDGDNDHDD
ncbi:MAG TPA: CHRD domain-containing protein [Kofleriaceae bacterium]|nr:CHRD domain-containing protein [Kofleriaceae bacterium]